MLGRGGSGGLGGLWRSGYYYRGVGHARGGELLGVGVAAQLRRGLVRLLALAAPRRLLIITQRTRGTRGWNRKGTGLPNFDPLIETAVTANSLLVRLRPELVGGRRERFLPGHPGRLQLRNARGLHGGFLSAHLRNRDPVHLRLAQAFASGEWVRVVPWSLERVGGGPLAQ